MTALWIILAVALVLTVLNLLPVGVDAAYADDEFSLAVRIGPFRLRLLPKPPDQKPKKKKRGHVRSLTLRPSVSSTAGPMPQGLPFPLGFISHSLERKESKGKK